MKRWYVLGVFCALSACQCLTWFTLGSAPHSVMTYFSISASSLDLILNWGPIAFVVAGLPVMWLISSPRGIRTAVIIGSSLVLSANLLRCLPSVFPHSAIGPVNRRDHSSASSSSSSASAASASGDGSPALVLIHIAQILNALAGPIVMAPVSLISATWFPYNERTTATMLGWCSNGFGFAVAYAIGPVLAPHPSRVPRLLFFEAAVSLVPFLLVMAHFPSRPNTGSSPPSSLLPSSASTNAAATSVYGVTVEFLRGMRRCFEIPSAVIAIIVGGVQFGVISGWAGCLPQVLLGVGFTQSQAGWVSFGYGVASLVGSMAVGILADMFWRRRLKALLLSVWLLTDVAFTWLALSLPLPWRGAGSAPVLRLGVGGVAVALCLVGAFQGSITPIIYEVLAEITAPVNQGTSTGLVTLLSQMVATAVLFVAPLLSPSVLNTAAFVALLVCTLFSLAISMRPPTAGGSAGNSAVSVQRQSREQDSLLSSS